MPILCPRHNTALNITEESLFSQFIDTPIPVGTCPFCDTRYIGIRFSSNCSVITINGIRYEFLQALSNQHTSPAPVKTQHPDSSIRITSPNIPPSTSHQPNQATKSKYVQQAKSNAKVSKSTFKHSWHSQRSSKKKKKLLRPPISPNTPIIRYPTTVGQPQHITYYHIPLSACPFDNKTIINVQVNHLICHLRYATFCPHCKTLFFPEYLQNTIQGLQLPVRTAPNPKEKSTITQHSNAVAHPSSSIAKVYLVEKGTQRAVNILIVAKEKDQNTENNIYWVGRTLSSCILSSILLKHSGTIYYKNSEYQIKKYTAYHNLPKYLKIISRFINPAQPQIVYIYSQKNISHFQNDNYEMVTAMVPCLKQTALVPLSLYYEKTTHQYFINEVSYNLAREKYGLPYMKIKPFPSSGSHSLFTLNAHSELFLLGYTVNSSSGLNASTRRDILIQAISSGIKTKHEIINHIEWLINTRNGLPQMENALSEWRSDLAFISQYNFINQRKIWVASFKGKYSF